MPSNHSEPTPGESRSGFAKLGDCLYRNESSGGYYALVKRHSKQFRRALKTSDRQLAQRRLTEFRQKVGRLAASTPSFGN